MRLPIFFLAALASAADEGAPGQRLFNAHCAPCHGIAGAGGSGPSLARLERAPDDAALLTLIRDGIPGTAMPRGWMFSERELGQVTAYVRSIGSVARQTVPGDPQRGSRSFAARGCGACHIVEGKGDAFGPELTSIGAQRAPAHLRESIVRPSASFPDGFAFVRADQPGRPAIEGVRIAEDTFTIQILDSSHRIRSLRKAALARLDRLPRSPMPAYEKMPPTELDDLVAYLVSLRGAR